MSNKLPCIVVCRGSVLAGGTSYAALGSGYKALDTTEANVQIRHRAAGTYSNLTSLIVYNPTTASSTVTFRKNATNGNQTFTVPATPSGTGEFTDSTHTDAITAGDDVSVKIVSGTGGDNMSYSSTSATFDTTTNFTTRFVNGYDGSNMGINVVSAYAPLGGQGNGDSNRTTEANSQFKSKLTATLQNMSVFVISNSHSGAIPVKSRKNGADGNLTVSITANTTGWFEDTTHSDSIVSGDLINNYYGTNSGTGLARFNILVDFVTTIGKTHFIGGGYYGGASTNYYGISGGSAGSTTEAGYAFTVKQSGTFSNLECYVVAGNSNSGTTHFKFRKNSADGNQVISISNNTTGYYEDTTNTDSVITTDTVTYKTDGGGGGTMTYGMVGSLGDFSATPAAGSAALTEGADTTTASGTEVITGSAALTEGADSASASGLAGIRGPAALTEDLDVAAGSGLEKIIGSAALTEGTDTTTASGLEVITGSSAQTEVADTVTASGLAGIRGSAALTEGADAAAGSGLEIITGSAALTEGADAAAASGLSQFIATAALTETVDAASATGLTGIRGPAAITESADTAAGSGLEVITGSSAQTEVADTVTASGLAGIRGSAALTEGADVANGSAVEIITGAGAVIEGADTVTASAIENFTATAALTEGADSASATGMAGIRGSAALTETNETANGSALEIISGSAAITEGADTVTASAKETFTGSGAATESGDSASGSGKQTFIATAAITETGDSASGSGKQTFIATAAITESADHTTATGLEIITGSGAATESNDTAASSGLEKLNMPTLELYLGSGMSVFILELIKFTGDPIPAAHMEDALKLDADGYVDLFQIILPNALGSIYIKLNKTVTWQGNTYEGTGVQIDGVGNYADDTVSRPKLVIFNPNGVYSYLLDQGLLDSATIVRYRVLKADIENDRAIYRRQQWKVSRIASVKSNYIGLELRDMLDGQNFLTPGRMFIPPDFPTVSLS